MRKEKWVGLITYLAEVGVEGNFESDRLSITNSLSPLLPRLPFSSLLPYDNVISESASGQRLCVGAELTVSGGRLQAEEFKALGNKAFAAKSYDEVRRPSLSSLLS